MQITFSLPHAFSPTSPLEVNKLARRILVDCEGRLNQPYRNTRSAPSLYEVRTGSVVFTLPKAFTPKASIEENSHALRCLLDCLVDFNRLFLSTSPPCPSLYEMIAAKCMYYRRTEVWDSIPALYNRGYGDCKSLSAAYVAQHIRAGLDCTPVFRWINREDKSGAVDYHILVQTADGSFEDPSKVAGMGAHENGPVIR